MEAKDFPFNFKSSIFYFIREFFLVKNSLFIEKNISLKTVSPSNSYFISRNIPYTDGNGNIISNIIVKSASLIVPESKYTFNYHDGTIRFNETIPNVTVFYKDFYFDLIDSFPNLESETFDKQIASITTSIISADQFEIGTTRQKWTARTYIDFFCFNGNMRDDINFYLMFFIKNSSIPIIDFKSCNILNVNGTLNTNFSFTELEEYNLDFFKSSTMSNEDLESQDKKKMYHSSLSFIVDVIF